MLLALISDIASLHLRIGFVKYLEINKAIIAINTATTIIINAINVQIPVLSALTEFHALPAWITIFL